MWLTCNWWFRIQACWEVTNENEAILNLLTKNNRLCHAITLLPNLAVGCPGTWPSTWPRGWATSTAASTRSSTPSSTQSSERPSRRYSDWGTEEARHHVHFGVIVPPFSGKFAPQSVNKNTTVWPISSLQHLCCIWWRDEMLGKWLKITSLTFLI